MPALAYLKAKLRPGESHRPPPPVKTYYLTAPPPPTFSASPEPSPEAIRPPLIPLPNPSPRAVQQLAPTALLFCFTHPDAGLRQGSGSEQDGAAQSPTAFFLECLPDPIGFLYHAALFIRRILHTTSPTESGGADGGRDVVWRHQLVELELEDKPGLAATSGGIIRVSLHWVANLQREVADGRKTFADATKEFKGVLLHELVHTVQYDAHSTCPGWLVESIADYCRLLAHLDPPHWRRPGQAERERGWEGAYDVGARFLAWLTGWDGSGASPGAVNEAGHGAAARGVLGLDQDLTAMRISSEPATSTSTSTSTSTTAQPTQYPSAPAPPAPPTRPGLRPRRGPWPDLVRVLDARMKSEEWDEAWWAELAGAPLERLWEEYMEYYA